MVKRSEQKPLRTRASSLAAGLIAIATAAFATPATVLPPPSAAPAAPVANGLIHTSQDASERMTVPVMVNGQGPFPFVVDTGANRSVISTELAAQLHLPADAPVLVRGTGGDDLEPTAHIGDLTVGARHIPDISAPTLSAANLGAMGMIGIDALHGQRMVIDFRSHTLSVEASQRERHEPNVVVVHAKSRYGQLILVDASIHDEPIAVILDTGAQNTVGNASLARLVGHIGISPIGLAGDVISVTGRTTPATFSNLRDVQIGGIELRNQPVAFAELHTFVQFDLVQRPAMLLGMDTLRAFDKVVVDFGRKEVRFKLADTDARPPVLVADARSR